MPEPLEEQLVLDISPALASIGLVDDALSTVISNFTAGFGDAFTAVTAQIAAPVDIPITADPSAAEAAVSGLDAPQTVPVDADVSQADTAIQGLDSTQVQVPVSGDTTEAAVAISALDTAPVVVSVDADTSQAQDSIDALGQSATKATGGGTEGLGGLEAAVLGVEAATGAAAGETAGLATGIGAIGGAGTAAAIGGGAAFVGFLGETIKLAADAQAQNRLFASTFGDVAEQARSINIGGLNISLEELGKQSGTAVANLEASATRVGLLGNASGAAAPQIANTAQSVLGIAGALSVANPRLGDAATVADTLTRALATGRTRSLIPYGISISSAAIQQEALNENIGKTTDTLTGYDKLLAGVTLVSQQFGDTLGTKFADGTQNAQVQLRALKTQLEETLVAVGTPLLGPAVASLQDFLPVAQAVGVALGQLAQAVLPIVTGLAPALIPVAQVITLVGTGITALADAVHGISGPEVLGIAAGFELLSIALGEGSIAAFAFGLALDTALGPVGIAIGALALLGGAFGLFHHDAPAATVDAKEFAAALLDSSVAAQDLQGKIAPLGPALSDQLGKLLEHGKAGQTAADGLEALGLSYDTLTKILLSSDGAFTKFDRGLLDTTGLSKDQAAAQLNLVDVLDETRAKLAAGASAALQAAVAQGTLTEAQISAVSVQTGVSVAGDGAIQIYEKLKPVIDATAAAQEAQTVASVDQAGAFAQLREELASGAISAAEATTQLTTLGLSAADAKTFIDGVTKSVQDFINTAISQLPTAGSEVDNFQKGVTDAFGQVAKDVHDKSGNVKADLADLKTALDPATFIKSLFADAATTTQFVENLRTLGEEGFTALVGVLAEKGPAAGGELAKGLASDENKARFATAGLAAGGAATDSLTAVLQQFAPQLVTQSQGLGDALGTGINTGFSAKIDLANQAAVAVAAAGQAVTVATPNAVALTEAAAGLITERFRGQLDLPGAAETQTTAATQKLKDAGGSQSASGQAAAGIGSDATAAYGGGLKLDQATQQSLDAARQVLSVEAQIVGTSHTLGVETGLAFGTGIVEGINTSRLIIGIAAASAAAQAEISAKAALGVKSPSTVGIDIGQQFVAGIAIGLQDVGAVVKAGHQVASSLSSSVKPTLPQLTIPTTLVPAGSTAGAGLSTLSLDLTVNLADGSTVEVPNVVIPVAPFRSRLAQKVTAQVAAG